jgi:hypothetical protein
MNAALRSSSLKSVRRITIALALTLMPFAVAFYPHVADQRRSERSKELISALQDKRWGDASRLLDLGANPNARGGDPDTDLSIAQRILSVFQPARDEGPHDVATGGRALQYAVSGGSLELTIKLLDRGATLADPSDAEQPLIRSAVASGNTEVARLLLDRGLKPDIAPHFQSPLESTVESYNVAMARLLIERGADLTGTITYFGNQKTLTRGSLRTESLMKYAERHKYREMADLLKRAGAPN